MSNPVSDFYRGFVTPGKAASFIKNHPGLARFIAVPLLINIAIFSLVVYQGSMFFQEITGRYLPQADAWYWLFLTWLLWLLAVIVTATLIFFTFTVAGNLIASPFNDLLSEKTEQIINGSNHETPFSLPLFLKDGIRTLVEESKKMFLFICGMLLILLCNLLPFFGTLLAAGLTVAWTIFFLTVEYTGYYFARNRQTFTDQRRFINSHKSLLIGFGTGLLCLLAIPFLQFFCIPLGVVGATMLCLEHGAVGDNNNLHG